MCGIVGYVGKKRVVPVIIDGLRRLEYRGYDSAGIAVAGNGGGLQVRRAEGKLRNLEEVIRLKPLDGTYGIGHTRWATHGRPTEENAHPHRDCTGKIVVVHNGIVENYVSLKKKLIDEGHKFRTETDTEVIAHLIEKNLSEADRKVPLEEAVRKTVKLLTGVFAIAVISEDEPNKIVAARNGPPAVIGLGKDEYFVASDVPAILYHTRDLFFLADGDLAVITPSGVQLTDFDGQPITREVQHITWDPIMAEKVHIAACGTSWHAGLAGKFMIERLAKLPVEVDYASEFRYRDPLTGPGDLTILITQSGETADTIAAMRESRAKGSKTLGICNVVGSMIAREANGTVYTHAGPEIGVASTKAFTAQLTALFLFAVHLAQVRGTLDLDHSKQLLNDLTLMPGKLEALLTHDEETEDLAKQYHRAHDFLFLGRGIHYPIALEGALKLKEISYIHAEGYPAGEMKHGPNALIDEDLPVVILATHDKTDPGSVLRYEKTLSNLKEVKARSGTVIAIATDGDEEIREAADHVLYVPDAPELLAPILEVVPCQLLAYHIAVRRGCDVDQPRNLAKSVTVE